MNKPNPSLSNYAFGALQALEARLRREVNADGADIMKRKRLLAVTAEIGRRRKNTETQP